MQVELITRVGCHLCDDALVAIREAGVEPVLLDVDGDQNLLRSYDLRVPVLILNGRVAAEGRFTARDVIRQIEPHAGN